ncbi:MAG: sugar transferase [Caenibius sp.]
MGSSANTMPQAVREADPPSIPEIRRVPSLERLRLRLYLLLLVGDMLALLGAYAIVGYFYPRSSAARALIEAQVFLPLFQTLALYNGTYSAGALTNLKTAMIRLATAILIAAGLLNFIAFYLKANEELSRMVFSLGIVLAYIAMVAMRWALSKWLYLQKRTNLTNTLVVDAGGPPITLPNTYRIDAMAHHLSPRIDDPDGLDRLGQALRNMDRVVVSCPPDERGDWAFVLRASAIRGEVISTEAHDLQALGVMHEAGGGFTTLVVSVGTLRMQSRILKRAFDVVVALTALALTAPILLVAAIAVKLEDGGPILFRQKRTGRANRYFTIYKFRTMTVGRADPQGHVSVSPGDRRVTRVGRFLRATSIDELPQFWNVLKSDMSIVGPRPHAIGSRAGEKLFWEVDSRYWHRHTLKPGLTGLAQIRGLRGSTDTEAELSDRLVSDLEYIAGWNIFRDVGIALKTLRVLIHRKAY